MYEYMFINSLQFFPKKNSLKYINNKNEVSKCLHKSTLDNELLYITMSAYS